MKKLTTVCFVLIASTCSAASAFDLVLVGLILLPYRVLIYMPLNYVLDCCK